MLGISDRELVIIEVLGKVEASITQIVRSCDIASAQHAHPDFANPSVIGVAEALLVSVSTVVATCPDINADEEGVLLDQALEFGREHGRRH